MNKQIIYLEVMEKFTEAQKIQNEIVECNYELQQMNNAIKGTNILQLKEQCNILASRIDGRIKDRDNKLNEALSKALDLTDTANESDNLTKGIALCIDAIGNIFSYFKKNNIQIQYSQEVNIKLAKVVAKEISGLEQLLLFRKQRIF